MITPIYAINTPLINYFIYKNGPNIGKPLVAGELHFFRNDDHATRADTYSDISDPLNPVVNPNPIVLSAVGSCPPIYLQDIPYFIIIKSAEGETDSTITNYRGATFNQDTNNLNDSTNNLLANGQFSYPIVFNRTDEPVGTIDEPFTNVAFGWYFAQDDSATGNLVTFGNVSNEVIEGSPQFECIVTSTTTTQEAIKYLAGIYGSATAFEGDELTFCIQLVNKNLSGSVPIVISIEKNFGDGGSPTTITDIATFDVTGERNKFTITFTNPSSVGSTVGTGNYAALRINYPLNQFFSVGATNALLQLGSFQDPIYVGQDFSMEVAQSLGSSTQIEASGLKDNYSQITYSDGLYFPLAQTGVIVLSAEGVDFPDKLEIETPGQTLPVSGYSEKNIPFRRLYNVIGNTYGGAGDLIVTSNANVVTFTSRIGERQRSNYTNGNIGAGLVVQNTVVGLKYDIDLEIDPSNDTQVIMTWLLIGAVDQVPGQSPPYIGAVDEGNLGNYFHATSIGRFPVETIPSSWGSQAISTVNVNPGSISEAAVSRIHFNSGTISSYASFNQIWNSSDGLGTSAGNMLEYQSNPSSGPARGNYLSRPGAIDASASQSLIRFQVNGLFGPMPTFEQVGVFHTITFNMLTSESLPENVARFIREVANSFVWTLTFNTSPTAGQYFLYSAGPSDTGTEYYGWYRVNGSGSDPMVPSRTGVMIDILSTDSTTIIAQKTAEAVNSLNFNLPTPGVNLPALPDDSKSSYYINL